MFRITCFLAALSLFAATTASAMSAFGGDVHIVSVDTAKKTIRLSFSDKKTLDGKEVVATWDTSTEWKDDRRDENAGDDQQQKPFDPKMAKSLEKSSAVYVTVNDRGSSGKTWWIDEVDVER